jgi:lipopolysaccharide transport system ATP-binding protein
VAQAAIEVQSVSKRYQLGARQKAGTFRELLSGTASRVLSPRGDPSSASNDAREFWALQDVNFSIAEGEVVGLVGRNGAGKSTLLKIISRITAPTSGRIVINGRVASLLEVGTGFHPELTGRENIFLNGAILGLRNAEIKKRFEEIVDFAEIDEFLDVPVKRYSSGMYVRLAFAVAAYMEPDVLIVDEVLAVGDAEFQKKCLAKIDDASRGSSRTVLFVSHNMQAVRRLCSRCIWLANGRVQSIGSPQDIIENYLEPSQGDDGQISWAEDHAPGGPEFRLLGLRVVNTNGQVSARHSSADDIFVEMDVVTSVSNKSLNVGFDLTSSDGAVVFRSYITDGPIEAWPSIGARTKTTLRCCIPAETLNAGRYQILPRASIHKVRWLLSDEIGYIGFDVSLDHGPSPHWVGVERPGVVAPVLRWSASTS